MLMTAGALYLQGYYFLMNSLYYLVRKKDVTGLSLGGSMACIGLTSVYSGLFYSEQILKMPYLIGIDNILNSIVLFCIAINILSILIVDFTWKNKYLLWLLYPLFQWVLFLNGIPSDEGEQLRIIQEAIAMNTITWFANPLAFWMQLAATYGVGLTTLYFIFKNFKWNKVPEKYKLKVFFAGLFFALVSIFALGFQTVHILSTVLPFGFSPFTYLVYHIYFYTFFIFAQIWPYYVKYGPTYYDTKTFKIDKYLSSSLQNTDLASIEEKIQYLMNNDELYKDEDLNIKLFAKKVKITPHQLSEYLNKSLGQNFSQFLNKWRIEEAKKILTQDTEIKMIELCYELGYNSPSVFYSAFKKYTGASPKEWLAKVEQKKQQ